MEEPQKLSYGAIFGQYLRPQWKKALFMAFLLLSSISLHLVEPQILRFFIDSARSDVALSVLTRAAILFLGVALCKQLLGAWATYLGADVGWTATNLLRYDLAKHCFSLDMSFHTSRTAGEMIERIDGDVTALSDFFSQFAVRVFGALLLLIGILVILWLENPWIGLALSLFTVLELLVLGKTRSLAIPATRLEREANAKLFGFIEERLDGIEDIRANGSGAHSMYRFFITMRSFFSSSRRAWMMRSIIWLSSYGLFVIGLITTLAASIYFVQSGAISLGTGYLVMQYMFMLQTPIDQITQQMQNLQKAGASIGRISDLLAIESKVTSHKKIILPQGALDVRFDKVSFSYEDKPTLKDLSFYIAPGEVLGLLGRTGSGKTTLTRLLYRFYDPSKGDISLGGIPLQDADLASLHAQIGLVTQEVQLFGASLRDNLSFFDQSITDKDIKAVLRELGLDRWLEGLAEGLDTPITTGGNNLSAGEAQLLAFARVFLHDPGLVILDEPSSRLDPATEKRLELAINKLLRGRSAIIIAHRLSTVERADKIMILDEGRSLEFGERQRLEKDKHSHFYKLLEANLGHHPSASTL